MNGGPVAGAEQVHGRPVEGLFLYSPAHGAQMLTEA